jgi:hypothetical protein
LTLIAQPKASAATPSVMPTAAATRFVVSPSDRKCVPMMVPKIVQDGGGENQAQGRCCHASIVMDWFSS